MAAAAPAQQEAAAAETVFEAETEEERLWLEGFGDEPEADEAEWDDALWEEGDGEVTLRAGAWEQDADAGAPARCDDASDPVQPCSEDEDTDDEEPPEVGSRDRFELRYTLTHPASRERICSAGDVLSEDAVAGGLVVGGVIHDRVQRYASHYTVEYLMVSHSRPPRCSILLLSTKASVSLRVGVRKFPSERLILAPMGSTRKSSR
mgnify:CR=1 FL=1|jgi:hypothetical protein